MLIYRIRSLKNHSPLISATKEMSMVQFGSYPGFDLFWQAQISAGLCFSTGLDRSQIVMSRDCH